jgi:hypothetical protein
MTCCRTSAAAPVGAVRVDAGSQTSPGTCLAARNGGHARQRQHHSDKGGPGPCRAATQTGGWRDRQPPHARALSAGAPRDCDVRATPTVFTGRRRGHDRRRDLGAGGQQPALACVRPCALCVHFASRFARRRSNGDRGREAQHTQHRARRLHAPDVAKVGDVGLRWPAENESKSTRRVRGCTGRQLWLPQLRAARTLRAAGVPAARRRGA